MGLIYIIIVNYNAYKDTIECVQSIRKIKHRNLKIVIVDNNSTDNSVINLQSSLKDCIIIECKKNLGFAGGNNLGIKYALENGADFILLLNNDTLVEVNFLDNMLDSFKINSKIGIVGCKIMYYPKKNRIWYGGGTIDWTRFIARHFGNKEIDRGQCDKEKEIDFLTGCCMLIKNEVFKNVGYLSEDYFMYVEDVDFCVRVVEAEYKIFYNPKAVIYHKVGLSSGGEKSPFAIKWCTRNRIIFINRFGYKVSRLNLLYTKIFFYATRFIRYFQYSIYGKSEQAKAIKEGVKEGRFEVRVNTNRKIVNDD